MNKTKRIVFISIYVALALALDFVKSFIPFLNMPSGGSINIALIPIVFCSFHLGVYDGCVCGFLWLVVSCLLGLNKYFVSFGQIFFDYIVPSVVPGISAIFYSKKTVLEIELGIFFAMLIRTFSICLSGAIYWFEESTAAGSLEAWNGSLIYNLPYSILTTIMLMIIVPLLIKTLRKYLV